jgi:hypothetical protein
VTESARPYVPKEQISFGDMELPSWVDLDAVIEVAGDDMDAVIGTRYKLPLELDSDNQEHYAIIKMLAKINRYLVVGRVVIDSAIGHEDTQMQAYGNYHIRWAEQALKAIANGDTVIPNQESILPDEKSRVTGPIMTTRDSGSMVDAFYKHDDFYGAVNTPLWQGKGGGC